MSEPQSPVRFTRRKKVLFAAIAVVGLAVAAELGVRLVCWATGRTPYTVATPWCRAADDLLYTFTPGFEGPIYQTTARINRHGLRGDDFPVAKPKGTKRVICLGDSRTFGYAVKADESYPAVLEKLGRERFKDGPLQVINAGVHGYTSYQGLRFLETRALAFQPDLVTVAFNFNDRRFVLEANQADGPQYFRQSARGLRWRNRMRFSFALLGFNKLVQHARGTDTWAKSVLAPPSQRLDDLHCRVEVEAFEKNLEAIARLCRERKIGCVFVLMEDAPRIEAAFEEGRRRREEKKYDEAVAVFAGLLGDRLPEGMRHWEEPLAHWEIGLTREAQGGPDEARAAFRESAQGAAFWSIMGGLPVRHTEPYVEATRRVAEKLSVPIVDIATKFREHPEYYYDFCHYTSEGEHAIARELLECIAGLKEFVVPTSVGVLEKPR